MAMAFVLLYRQTRRNSNSLHSEQKQLLSSEHWGMATMHFVKPPAITWFLQ